LQKNIILLLRDFTEEYNYVT